MPLSLQDISNNKIKSLPSEISSLGHLMRFVASNNQIKELPSTVGQINS